MKLSEKIKHHRKIKKFTQRELARLAGVGPSTIGCLESDRTGAPFFPTISAIAKALGVTVEYLVGEDKTYCEDVMLEGLIRDIKSLSQIDQERVRQIVNIFNETKTGD